MSNVLGNMPIVHRPHGKTVRVWLSVCYCIFVMITSYALLAVAVWNATLPATEWGITVLRIAGSMQLLIATITHTHIFIYGLRRNGLNGLLKSIRDLQNCNLPRPSKKIGNKVTVINSGAVIFCCIFTAQYVLYGINSTPMADFYHQFQYSYTTPGYLYVITFFATAPTCLALYLGYITTMGIYLVTSMVITDEMELFSENFKKASSTKFDKISLSELDSTYDALTEVCGLVSSLWSPWYSFCTCIMVPSICFIGYNAVFPFDAMSIFYTGLFCAFLAAISVISSLLDTAVSSCFLLQWFTFWINGLTLEISNTVFICLYLLWLLTHLPSAAYMCHWTVRRQAII